MDISRIDELINAGDLIELPPLSKDTKFIVKVRKPDIMSMLIDDKIPNPLIKVALNMTEDKKGPDIFKDNQNENDADNVDIEKTKRFIEFLRVMAKEALIEPKYQELEEAGIVLNTSQLMVIYQYITNEVQQLESFRK